MLRVKQVQRLAQEELLRLGAWALKSVLRRGVLALWVLERLVWRALALWRGTKRCREDSDARARTMLVLRTMGIIRNSL